MVKNIFICIFNFVLETPKHERKRKCFVGDIKTPDLLTPRKSKCHFKKAKLQILVQKKKIKNLNQTVRRLRNKLSSLGALFKHLKNNNLITENAHDEILVLSVFYEANCFFFFNKVPV